MPKPKILIFHQQTSIGEFYKEELQNEGYDVLMTSSLRDALRIFRIEKPALVLLSIERFGVKLLGTVEQMLSADARVPIIFAGSGIEDPDLEDTRSSLLISERRFTFVELKHAILDLCPFSTTIANAGTGPTSPCMIPASNTIQIAGIIA